MIQRKKGFWEVGISKKLGLMVFLVALGLILFESFFFWRESLFYLDGNKVLFELYENEWFSYMHNRFGMAITQVLPVLFLKLNVGSPKFIFIVQSLSFSFPPIIALFTVTFLFKDYKSTLLILFFYVLGSIDIHYIKEWGASAALYLVIITGSYFQNYFKSENKWHRFVAFALIFLTINTHPTTACFFAMFFLVRHQKYKKKLKLAYIATIFLSLVAVVSLNIYVDNRVSEAMSFVFFEGGVVIFLKHYIFQYEMIVLYLAVAGYLLYKRTMTKETVLAMLVPLVCLVLIFSFLTVYFYNDRDAFYFECQVFLIVVAMLYFPMHRLVEIKSVYLIVFVVAVVRFFALNFNADNRVQANIKNNEALMETLDEKYPGKNVFIVNRESSLTMQDFPDFFIYFESYLMSSYLYGRGNEKVIYLTNDTNMYFDHNGFPIFFNYVGPVDGKIDFDDPTTFGGFIDPTHKFPNMEISESTIQKLK